MAYFHSPTIATNGLVLCLDAANGESFRGEPTTNIQASPTMIPSNSNDVISSTSTTQNNVGSSGWSWGYFPDSNISADGGMVWLPNEPDPFGGIGVWMMKKRAGGNSESQFVGQAPGAIDTNSTYTLSVYCKANVANTARIHINVTLNGASNWSYASSTHTGDGSWQRLTLTIPGGVGITSINVVRCQSLGTTTNTNIYWKYFQIEAKSYATPFVNGTRGTTVATGGGFGDLSGNGNNGELVNGTTYNSSNLGSLVFDGVDDWVGIPTLLNSTSIGTSTTLTISIWFNVSIMGDRMIFSTGQTTNDRIYLWTQSSLHMWRVGNFTDTSNQNTISLNKWHFTTLVINGTNISAYLDGVLDYTGTYTPFTTKDYAVFGRHGLNSIYSFSGKIGVSHIYNRPLSAAEVLQNYNATKGRYGL
jgi:hypothetical protein